MLWDMVAEGDFVKEEKPCYYIYELTMDGRVQTGITACASIVIIRIRLLKNMRIPEQIKSREQNQPCKYL